MCSRYAASAFGICLALMGPDLRAQVSDSAAVIAQAADYIAADLSKDKLVIVADSLERAARVQCLPRRPDSCRLMGANVVLQAVPIEINDNKARALVTVWRRGISARQPVHRVSYRLLLRRCERGWTVEKVEGMSST